MAKTVGAELAGPRGCNEYRFSLSPASLSEIVAGTKFVLPSPNGSTISAAAHRTPVLAGCLRNALAVARKAIAIARGSPVAVIPTGERWPDGSLRPAIEDLIGDGAIIDELGLRCSPEGEIARQAFRGALPAMAELLRGRTSGRELIDRGYPQDVEAAINSNVSPTTPLLVDGAYNV
jgi:2-phosphosulfolactate phosphatase